MDRGGWWRGAAMVAIAGCIPEPVLRARDAGFDAMEVAGGASDVGGAIDAGGAGDVGGVIDATDAGGVIDASDAGGVAAPRLRRPLSFAVVGTQLPELRWELPAQATGARVEVCADRDCARVEHAADAMGGLYRVTEALRAGAHFWRVRARYGGELGPPSPTWEFLVQGASSSMVSWYGFVDVDRDGVADIVVGAPQANAQRGAVMVWRGKDMPSREPLVTLERRESQVTEFGTQLSVGDFDGDGRSDVVALSAYNGISDVRLWVYRLALHDAVPEFVGAFGGAAVGGSVQSYVRALGDVNGDGYGDVGVGNGSLNDGRGEVRVFLGGPSGLSDSRYVSVRPDVPTQTRFGAGLIPVGDIDADGVDDVIVSAGAPGSEEWRAFLMRGRTDFVTQQVTPVELTGGAVRGRGHGGSSAGDIDRDGRADFVLSATEGGGLLYRSPVSGGAMPLALNMSNTACPKLRRVYAGGFDHNGDQLVDFAATCEVTSMRVDLVLLTGPNLPPSTVSPGVVSPSGGGLFASQLMSYGDFNADGLADLVTTTPFQDGSPTTLAVHWGTRSAAAGARFELQLPMGFGANDPLVLAR